MPAVTLPALALMGALLVLAARSGEPLGVRA